MYLLRTKLKHRIQVEFDNFEELELVKALFRKQMIWTDPPVFELSEGMKWCTLAQSTKQNLKNLFNTAGIVNKPYDPAVPHEYSKFANRCLYDRKFIKKKMSRNNHLPTVFAPVD